MESEPVASTRIRTSAETGPVIALAGVDVVVEGRRVLADLTWQLEPGAHWGVTGANGAGKSTFLALLAGTRWPAPGTGMRRYDFGRGAERDAVGARRRITLVGHELQDRFARLDWNFRAADVVLSGLQRTDVPQRGAARSDRRAACRLLGDIGLAELAERPFLELSRGEQRRVLIARAFAFAPRVLLLDEPASGLDAAARESLDALLEHVGASTQIVAAAHTVAQLPRLCTHVLELERGRLRTAPARPPAPEVRTPHTAARPAAARHSSSRDGPVAELRGATVWLGEHRALAAVDWRLEAGADWLVTGANGAGKSTLLKLLHGQLRPARGGSVRWPGLGEPADVWQLRRAVAWVSAELQADYVYAATVAECIGSGFAASIGLVRALSDAERARVAELMRAFELEALASRALTSLSYGQVRRTLIARTLVTRPRLLLLDEPWEGLDPATAALVTARLSEARRSGTQLVCASHLGDFELGLDHELVLERGRVIRQGPRRRSDGGESGAPLENSTNEPRPGSRSRGG